MKHTPLRRAVLTAGAALVLLLIYSSPASADSGDPVFTVESARNDGPDATTYLLRVTWANDGHAVQGATITATPIAPDGGVRTPVNFTAVDEDGRYEATALFDEPGAWTVRFTSVNPVGTLEVTRQVAASTTTTTTEDSATTTAEVPPQTAVANDDAAATGDEDDGSSTTPVIVVATLVLAAFVAAVVLVVRRRSAA